jgi:hypothetical protein
LDQRKLIQPRKERASVGGKFTNRVRGTHPAGQGGEVEALLAGARGLAPGRVRGPQAPPGHPEAEGLDRTHSPRRDRRFLPRVRRAGKHRRPSGGLDSSLRRLAQGQALRVPRLRLHPSRPQLVSGTGLRGRGDGTPPVGSSPRRGGLAMSPEPIPLIGGSRAIVPNRAGRGSAGRSRSWKRRRARGNERKGR